MVKGKKNAGGNRWSIAIFEVPLVATMDVPLRAAGNCFRQRNGQRECGHTLAKRRTVSVAGRITNFTATNS
jgi:hypothetical protein